MRKKLFNMYLDKVTQILTMLKEYIEIIIKKKLEEKEKLKIRKFYKNTTNKKILTKFMVDTIIQKMKKITWNN